jgi:hypothetical protein
MTGSAHMMLKLRFVHRDTDRYGRVCIYFWRKGQSKIRIREVPGTPLSPSSGWPRGASAFNAPS